MPLDERNDDRPLGRRPDTEGQNLSVSPYSGMRSSIGFHLEISGQPVRFPNGMKIRFYDFGEKSGPDRAADYARRHFPEQCAEGRVRVASSIHPKAAACLRGAEKGVLIPC